MKQLWKMAAAALVLGVCAVGTSLPVSAQQEKLTDTVYLNDEAGVLSDTEFEDAMQQLEETSAYTGMNIGLYVGGIPLGSGEDSTIAFCDDFYDELYDINSDGVFLYLDFSGEDDLFDYLSTSGKGQFYYTNSDFESRTDEIISDTEAYLERDNEKLPQAISAFCDDMMRFYDAGVPDKYYTYNEDTDTYLILENNAVKEVSELPDSYDAGLDWGMIILISVIVGMIVGTIVLLCINARYKFKTAGSMRNYLENGNVRFTVRTDRFLRQHRSRTKISSESSGGGSGGGSSHSSSSGGSHGGGGGHR